VTLFYTRRNFIWAGITKYGKGKWTSIINDQEYRLGSTRTTATLLTRQNQDAEIADLSSIKLSDDEVLENFIRHYTNDTNLIDITDDVELESFILDTDS